MITEKLVVGHTCPCWEVLVKEVEEDPAPPDDWEVLVKEGKGDPAAPEGTGLTENLGGAGCALATGSGRGGRGRA